MSEWQPISSAPKDGTNILLSNGDQVAEGQWISDPGYIRERRDVEGYYIGQDEYDGFEGWMDYDGGMPNPTHWMPLPQAPNPPIVGDDRDTKTIDLFQEQAS